MVRGSNAVKDANRPDSLRGPPSLLYNRHQVSFPGVKQTGRGANNPPSLSAKFASVLAPYLCACTAMTRAYLYPYTQCEPNYYYVYYLTVRCEHLLYSNVFVCLSKIP